MRLSHWEAFEPVCPLCVIEFGEQHKLLLDQVLDATGDVIHRGIISCPAKRCRQAYPIVDAVPILVPNVREYVGASSSQILQRRDLDQVTDRILGAYIGPGTVHDTTRQYLSTYAWDAYAEFDPDEPMGTIAPGSIARLVHASLDTLGRPVESPLVDIGCSVGRSTFELANRTDGLVLGVDLNFSMIQLAQSAMLDGAVSYAKRINGVFYEQKSFAVDLAGSQVDFWVCDGQALPLSENTIGSIVALNLLDCVTSPVSLLSEIHRVTTSGGNVCLTTPLDWSVNATPFESWIGGYAPDFGSDVDSDPVESLLMALEACHLHPISNSVFEWTLRVHSSHEARYEVIVTWAEVR